MLMDITAIMHLVSYNETVCCSARTRIMLHGQFLIKFDDLILELSLKHPASNQDR